MELTGTHPSPHLAVQIQTFIPVSKRKIPMTSSAASMTGGGRVITGHVETLLQRLPDCARVGLAGECKGTVGALRDDSRSTAYKYTRYQTAESNSGDSRTQELTEV